MHSRRGLRFPPLLPSRIAPTTSTWRTASVNLRVATQRDSASDEPPEFSPPDGSVPPVPRRFAVKDGQLGSVSGVSLALPFRLSTGLGTGIFVLSVLLKGKYLLCLLHLHFLRPTFRPMVLETGGKKQFPYMVDPNTGVAIYESDEIIKYLADTYGDETVPVMELVHSRIAMILRVWKGSSYTISKLPPQIIEIWAYETLVELELPHLLHSCARGSPMQQEIFKTHGLFQAPYIEDPNMGVKMFESARIIEYLRATYSLYPQ
ncbi:hypothetical protein VPH35_069769 [Triticum aestivum]